MPISRLWSLAASLCAGGAAAALAAGCLASGRAAETPAPSANLAAAARYLDGREAAWQAWDRTEKDRGTFCVSCHTQATFAIARPTLRRELGDADMTPAEQAMLASITKRVRLWSQMQPFYSDIVSGAGKEVESHNAEAVLNTVILTSYDAPDGHLSDTTRTAFDNAWALQSKTGPSAGAWVWQNFGYAPWESNESEYHWAALMAVTVAGAPDDYRRDPKIAANLAALTGYLRAHYDAQPLLNQLVALWASAAFPDAAAPDARTKLVARILALQHPDGGWSLTDLGAWKRRDGTPLATASDGYATALVVLVLEKAAPDARLAAAHVARGIQWLLANQDKATGAWTAWSVNKNRDPASMEGHFMTDAATGYAVLALAAGR